MTIHIYEYENTKGGLKISVKSNVRLKSCAAIVSAWDHEKSIWLSTSTVHSKKQQYEVLEIMKIQSGSQLTRRQLKKKSTKMPSRKKKLRKIHTCTSTCSYEYMFINKTITAVNSRQHAVHRFCDGRALDRLTRRHEPLHSEPRSWEYHNVITAAVVSSGMVVTGVKERDTRNELDQYPQKIVHFFHKNHGHQKIR